MNPTEEMAKVLDAFDENQIKELIRDVLDHPSPGIVFKDISPLLLDPKALNSVIRKLAEVATKKRPTIVAGIEARGFIFGALVALELGVGFVPLRKTGKLPRQTFKVEYELEYGKAQLEMHTDAIKTSDSVLLIDDVLATGGTASAGIQLIEQANATVSELAFVIEISALKGRSKIQDHTVHSLITY